MLAGLLVLSSRDERDKGHLPCGVLLPRGFAIAHSVRLHSSVSHAGPLAARGLLLRVGLAERFAIGVCVGLAPRVPELDEDADAVALNFCVPHLDEDTVCIGRVFFFAELQCRALGACVVERGRNADGVAALDAYGDRVAYHDAV